LKQIFSSPGGRRKRTPKHNPWKKPPRRNIFLFVSSASRHAEDIVHANQYQAMDGAEIYRAKRKRKSSNGSREKKV
jgi:hypothetical protein